MSEQIAVRAVTASQVPAPGAPLARHARGSLGVAAALGATGCGAFIALGKASTLGLAAVLVLALVFGVAGWRTLAYAMLVASPFLGIPVIVTYPRTQYAVLAKDFLFVLPLYLGIALTLAQAKVSLAGLRPIAYPAVFFVLACLLAALASPTASTPLVALVGGRVWALYVPMTIVGYLLVDSRRALARVLDLMVVLAMVPALVGIGEALLVYGGQEGLVYSLYGPAAGAVTQQYAGFIFGNGRELVRLPSIFSFVTQYFLYLCALMVVAYSCWRRRPRSRWRVAALLVIVFASFLTGSRGAFVMVPLLGVLIVALDAIDRNRVIVIAATIAALAAAVVAVLGLEPTDLAASVLGAGAADLESSTQNLPPWSSLLIGHGLGTATGAIRYVVGDEASISAVTESLWVRAAYEMGAIGLLATAALHGTILVCGVRVRRALRDPWLVSVASAIVAFVAWNAIYFVKGSTIDFDPVNVYYWLLIGILLRLPYLEATAETPTGEAPPSAGAGRLQNRFIGR